MAGSPDSPDSPDSAGSPEPVRVVLVDEDGTAVGTADRGEAHRAPGRRHLAVSVQLIDPERGWLVQRRAAGKALFAGRWANSCCTHPLPGEDPEAAARRRIGEELGVAVGPLVAAGSFEYRAADPASPYVEHELDLVFVGAVDGDRLAPDPGEVGAVALLPYDDALGRVSGTEGTPWAPAVLRLAAQLRT